VIGKKIVLLVDDEPDIHDLFEIAVAKYGKNIVVENATSGENGIKKYEELKRCGMKPHLVLMDIKMHGMDGIEATKYILRMDGGANILALTAFEDDESAKEMTKAGAQGIIKKSENIKDIIKKISEKLDKI